MIFFTVRGSVRDGRRPVVRVPFRTVEDGRRRSRHEGTNTSPIWILGKNTRERFCSVRQRGTRRTSEIVFEVLRGSGRVATRRPSPLELDGLDGGRGRDKRRGPDVPRGHEQRGGRPALRQGHHLKSNPKRSTARFDGCGSLKTDLVVLDIVIPFCGGGGGGGGVRPEPGAGLLPLALGAPEVALLESVDLAALLAVPDATGRRLGGRGTARRADEDEFAGRTLKRGERPGLDRLFSIKLVSLWAYRGRRDGDGQGQGVPADLLQQAVGVEPVAAGKGPHLGGRPRRLRGERDAGILVGRSHHVLRERKP